MNNKKSSITTPATKLSKKAVDPALLNRQHTDFQFGIPEVGFCKSFNFNYLGFAVQNLTSLFINRCILFIMCRVEGFFCK